VAAQHLRGAVGLSEQILRSEGVDCGVIRRFLIWHITCMGGLAVQRGVNVPVCTRDNNNRSITKTTEKYENEPMVSDGGSHRYDEFRDQSACGTA
jgi:hypothetical protein